MSDHALAHGRHFGQDAVHTGSSQTIRLPTPPANLRTITWSTRSKIPEHILGISPWSSGSTLSSRAAPDPIIVYDFPEPV